MNNDDADGDSNLGAFALAALAAGGAMLFWKLLGSSNKETKLHEMSRFMQIANALADQGKYNDAIQILQKVIEVNPTDPEAYNLIAWILVINDSSFDQALMYVNKAIELTPDHTERASFYDTLAEIYARTGQFDEAIYYFRESLRIASNADEVLKDFSPSFRLALCYNGQGNSNASLFFLNQALQVHPQNPFIHLVMGDKCLQIEHYIEAIQYYQKALHLSEQWMNFHYPAVGDFNTEEERRSFQSVCWANMGVVYFFLKEYEESRAANEKACELYPLFPSVWLSLAALAARSNTNDQQVRHYLEKGLTLMDPLRDGHILTYLITTQDFGEYRPIMLRLLKNHEFISETNYRALLSSAPQGGALPTPSSTKVDIMFVGQNDIKGGLMSIFDQRGQQNSGNQNNTAGNTTIGTQNTAQRDINIGTLRSKVDLITELEKIQAQLKKAKSDKVIDAKIVTEANHQLEQAADQANSTAPEKHVILEHMNKAKELIQSIASAAGIVSTLVKLAEQVPHLF